MDDLNSGLGTLYKVLNEDGSARMGTGKWYLPKNGAPGRWMPKIDRFIPCESGYHLCRRRDLLVWLGPAIYIAEYRGALIVDEDKIVVASARLLTKVETWNERTARLFACDCAEHVLPLFEDRNPSDDRPRKAIEVARRFAVGEATREELDAARDAAWDAARAAAGTAERAWQEPRLFDYLEGRVV